MRKNCRDVLNAWHHDRSLRRAESIWTDGESIYSYRTCLVTLASNGRILFNATKYSPTTSNHQHAMRVEWGINHPLYGTTIPNTFAVSGLKFGATPADLKAAYEAVTARPE